MFFHNFLISFPGFLCCQWCPWRRECEKRDTHPSTPSRSLINLSPTPKREEASTLLLLPPFYLLLLLLQLPTSLCDKRRRRRSGGKRRRRREKRKVAQRYLLLRPPKKESLGEIPPQRRAAEWVPAQFMPFTTTLPSIPKDWTDLFRL